MGHGRCVNRTCLFCLEPIRECVCPDEDDPQDDTESAPERA